MMRIVALLFASSWNLERRLARLGHADSRPINRMPGMEVDLPLSNQRHIPPPPERMLRVYELFEYGARAFELTQEKRKNPVLSRYIDVI
jgi:hypothetical protein